MSTIVNSLINTIDCTILIFKALVKLNQSFYYMPTLILLFIIYISIKEIKKDLRCH